MTCVNSIALAVLTNIVIGADGAHVADALDWSHVAAIADKVLMEYVGLFNALLFEEVLEHVLEGLVAVLTNFTLDGCCNCSKLFG
jgi:hypothetical protein